MSNADRVARVRDKLRDAGIGHASFSDDGIHYTHEPLDFVCINVTDRDAAVNALTALLGRERALCELSEHYEAAPGLPLDDPNNPASIDDLTRWTNFLTYLGTWIGCELNAALDPHE